MSIPAFDLNSICRGCLSDNKSHLRKLSTIKDMFISCTNLEVSDSDGLPTNICTTCFFKCVSWHSFKQQCLQTDSILRCQITNDTASTINKDSENYSSILPNENRSTLDLNKTSTIIHKDVNVVFPTQLNANESCVAEPIFATENDCESDEINNDLIEYDDDKEHQSTSNSLSEDDKHNINDTRNFPFKFKIEANDFDEIENLEGFSVTESSAEKETVGIPIDIDSKNHNINTQDDGLLIHDNNHPVNDQGIDSKIVNNESDNNNYIIEEDDNVTTSDVIDEPDENPHETCITEDEDNGDLYEEVEVFDVTDTVEFITCENHQNEDDREWIDLLYNNPNINNNNDNINSNISNYDTNNDNITIIDGNNDTTINNNNTNNNDDQNTAIKTLSNNIIITNSNINNQITQNFPNKLINISDVLVNSSVDSMDDRIVPSVTPILNPIITDKVTTTISSLPSTILSDTPKIKKQLTKNDLNVIKATTTATIKTSSINTTNSSNVTTNNNNNNKHTLCHICNKKFRNADRLNSHIRTHMGLRPEECKICGKAFNSLRSLRRHRTKHNDEKLYACNVCGRTYKYATSLTLHKRVHTDVRGFVCDLCGKGFVRAHGLKSHLITHKTETPFSCQLCEKQFKNEIMLKNHQMRHTGIKPFQCNSCGKQFATGAELRTHDRTHSGVKPFDCLVCDKSYKTKSHLAVHFRSHTGSRPYACDLCPLKFAHNKVLKQHRLTHTGERPYECEMCSKTFRQKSTLSVHMYTHGRAPRRRPTPQLIVEEPFGEDDDDELVTLIDNSRVQRVEYKVPEMREITSSKIKDFIADDIILHDDE